MTLLKEIIKNPTLPTKIQNVQLHGTPQINALTIITHDNHTTEYTYHGQLDIYKKTRITLKQHKNTYTIKQHITQTQTMTTTLYVWDTNGKEIKP